ncbi:uncharacterized protein LOC121734828 [Aricia agestis]|uniref:uncharacterized protein LOC121734828 n=1 Tax=Aricia agestis TaxID=91739 RepID=UPI001C207F6A|nr:uncharacterized protein LOC121734828 [Aricia agestis]
MIVLILTFCTLCAANDFNYNERIKTYQLEVPGKEPITIIEDKSSDDLDKFDLTEVELSKDDADIKDLMDHIVYDKRRCYGPSCQEGFVANEGPQGDLEDFVEDEDKLKDFHDFPNERLQAIAALAAKLKKQKLKPDRLSISSSDEEEDDSKVYTSWNRVKVKQHKHPYDDKDGWVTLEPVAWSTSKISKWKPNIKKHKPQTYWNEDDGNKYPDDDRYPSQGQGNTYNNYYPQKKPILTRPGYINNKLHIPEEYESELPSRPTWTMNKPQSSFQHSMQNMQPVHNIQSMHDLQSSWSPDDSRRPYRPNCDKDEGYSSDDNIYYGASDSVVTDSRPTNYPYEYEALHQPFSQKRPLRRPTQVIYTGTSDMDDDRSSRPPNGDGQWILLSTTKGYKNKKRQRSLNEAEDKVDSPTLVSHQAVALTVLPMDKSHQNMTTSHGGLLEVEKSFQTVEESKRDMDLKNDLEMAASQNKPVRHKYYKKKLIASSNYKPDTSTVLAAVGAGMVPAAMAMVVPMMLGKRRRRDVITHEDYINEYLDKLQ